MNNRELYHYGIKGMKWGERRYQNEDGSYTPEGEIRYNRADSLTDDQRRQLKKELRRTALKLTGHVAKSLAIDAPKHIVDVATAGIREKAYAHGIINKFGGRKTINKYRNADGAFDKDSEKRYISDMTKKIQEDIHSYDKIKNGMYDRKTGKMYLSKDDVKGLVDELKAQKRVLDAKYANEFRKKVKKYGGGSY